MAAAICLTATSLFAQHVPDGKVPSSVRSALMAKYPNAKGVTWEKERQTSIIRGGASKEDNSVTFTPEGSFSNT